MELKNAGWEVCAGQVDGAVALPILPLVSLLVSSIWGQELVRRSSEERSLHLTAEVEAVE